MYQTLLDIYLAAPGDQGNGVGINWPGIQGFLKNLAGPILMVLGIIVLAASRSGNYAKTFGIFGNAIIGICMIVGGGVLLAFGDTLVNTIFA